MIPSSSTHLCPSVLQSTSILLYALWIFSSQTFAVGTKAVYFFFSSSHLLSLFQTCIFKFELHWNFNISLSKCYFFCFLQNVIFLFSPTWISMLDPPYYLSQQVWHYSWSLALPYFYFDLILHCLWKYSYLLLPLFFSLNQWFSGASDLIFHLCDKYFITSLL
jgi:hypothetical protein